MTFNPEPYNILLAILNWLLTFGGFAVLVFMVTFVGSIVMHGAFGPGLLFARIKEAFVDIFSISCRRTWALSQLTVKEAIRRKALMVFVVFAVLFMFAGWFLSDTNERAEMQIKVYVSFVLTAITWLVVPVVMLISCWGLPEDIKARTLHTVTTKPARKSEIVIGRMLGYSIVGTILLTIMGGIGYVWIVRQAPSILKLIEEEVDGLRIQARESKTELEVLVSEGNAEPRRYTTKNARELRQNNPEVYDLLLKARQAKLDRTLVSRVPVYGYLSFKDRQGNDTNKGINTGDIWSFRSYIEGATKARAIWNFSGVDVSNPEKSLTLEARFEAFRTHKGTMGTGLLCRYVLVNDDDDLRVPLPSFEIKEFNTNLFELSPQLTFYDDQTKSMQTVSLYDDVVQDGQLTVEVQCLDHSQYLGMAQSDLFLRLPDKHFASGYFKSILGVWSMVVLIVILSVTASCFVKGPVATLLTFSAIIFGQWFRTFMTEIVHGEQLGGGAFESIYRIIKHMNPITEMPDTMITTVIRALDSVLFQMLWLVEQAVPDFGYFRLSPYIANGFDVPWMSAPGLVPGFAMVLAYLLPCLLIGYYSLTLRELESK